VCPVFALSLWLASNEEITISVGPIFPGSNQQLRFNKLFWLFLNEHSQLVHACDCDPNLLGVHSFRKGSLTFLSYGSTAGPKSGAIHKRAGWSQGKVNDTYILFKRAGDQFIGRILAGLNIDQHKFAALPPRFGVRGAADGVSFCVFVYLLFVPFLYVMHLTNSPSFFDILQETFTKLMQRVYPISAGTPQPLIGVLLKCLAFLCLHHDSVIEVVRGASGQCFIPGYNSLFQQPLDYEARTVGYRFCTDEAFKNDVVTGIPPHVDQLVSMDSLLKEQHSIGDLVNIDHTCLLDAISSNQVCTLLSEFTSTMIDRLGKRGG
jgi:hypothetical protein